MKYRALGRTDLTVSALSLGTVSLGLDYGIRAPGGFGQPSEDDAIELLRAAADRGITLFDTAPAYGSSEQLLGRALGGDRRCHFATKILAESLITSPSGAVGETIDRSVEESRRALRRDALDVLQIHNATPAVLTPAVLDGLVAARDRGHVRWLGASVYGEEAALALIAAGPFAVLQIAVNVLDQRMVPRVLPAAERAGVGVIVRSAFLKGALTAKAQWLPDTLAPLREAAVRTRDRLAGGEWERLPQAAIRYCLSLPHVASVLTGARTVTELNDAIAAEAEGPLDADALAHAPALALEDERLLNPSQWPAL